MWWFLSELTAQGRLSISSDPKPKCLGETMSYEGSNIMPSIHAVQNHMKEFCNQVHSGQWRGFTNKVITDIVNIGIGGSDLGPLMVTESLKPFKKDLSIHFVSNVDGTHISETVKKLNGLKCYKNSNINIYLHFSSRDNVICNRVENVYDAGDDYKRKLSEEMVFTVRTRQRNRATLYRLVDEQGKSDSVWN